MITKKDIMKLEGLLFLLAISQYGSKRKAAESLSMSIDTVNKYISDLEIECGIKLFANNGRGTTITPEALKIVDLAFGLKSVVSQITACSKGQNEVKGTVRMGVPEGIAPFFLLEGIFEFYNRYPGLKVEAVSGDEFPKINLMDVDIVIGYTYPENPDLILISKKELICAPFAAPEYIEKFGMPRNFEDMVNNHRICNKSNFSTLLPEWKDVLRKTRNITYTTNSTLALVENVRRGTGISMMPVSYLSENLVRISTVPIESKLIIYLIAHKDTMDIPRIRVTLDYLTNILESQ